ncbi:hypothetical protein G5C51_24470 [Streptomyces sp. A7024]|uniref:Uncharacterized protein n=1 Tax=Streptomyces coryli TaxID=1128680 RepID=A0A6G4U5N5_9ACTN|nr:hypothetical protein [Streptomyces coryli]NGN67050.1 hypothetical protein [Streptomyces coryli]
MVDDKGRGLSYDLLLLDWLDAAGLAVALARVVGVPAGDVDVVVGDSGRESRAWGAAVLCDCEVLGAGDIALSVSVYVRGSVPNPLPEPQAAAALAAAARTVVFHSTGVGLNPAAYWAVTPDGLQTRASVEASGDEPLSFTVATAEAALPRLPNLRVVTSAW